MDKGIALTPTISKNLSSSALAPLAQSKLRLGTADFRRECFWRISKPPEISWRKPMPRGEAPRQLLRQIKFGGVCLKKSEPILRKTLKTNADSAGRNNVSGGMDSPCIGSRPARRRGLGRNAGGFRTGGFRKFGGYKID